MTITDAEVLKELKKVRCYELEESLEEYPEDERDGRSDFQMLADECSYILSCYDESGHCYCEDLEESKEILRETKNGKVIPLYKTTLTPVYSKSRIENARNTINQHKRLQSLMKRLNDKGYFGKW